MKKISNVLKSLTLFSLTLTMLLLLTGCGQKYDIPEGISEEVFYDVLEIYQTIEKKYNNGRNDFSKMSVKELTQEMLDAMYLSKKYEATKIKYNTTNISNWGNDAFIMLTSMLIVNWGDYIQSHLPETEMSNQEIEDKIIQNINNFKERYYK